ncbi:ATP-binding protein [Halopseudomonas sp. Lyrl_26]|uniref:ATP-binding protein n=1 Tax=Halopseudomonas sp. Lyrl_26 TaxID=3110923 RepID=UPI003F7F6FDA
MNSISRRLGGGLLLVLLLTVTLVGQGAVWVFDRALRDYLSRDLQREADALLAAVSNGPQGLYLDTGRVSPDYMRLYSGRYFIVEAGPHRWRSRSLWDQRLPMPLDSADHTLQPGPSGQQLLVRSERFNKLGQSVQISVALDYQPLLEAFARARVWLWGLGGLAVLISLAVQQLLLRKALRPLRQARQELAEWQAGQRLQLSDQVPQELLPLVQEVNHLGAQLERLIQRARKGVGDLSHGLKTPLAVVERLLTKEVLDVGDREVLRQQIEQIRRQLERALQRARLAPERQLTRRFSAAEDLPWLCTSVQQSHDERVRIEYPDLQGKAPWPFEREDMLELLGNLLDNACKWARSRVRLEWQVTEQELLLSVEDDGPGISEADRQRVLQRGVRLDEAVTGHGLGLDIVGDLVEVYNGDLQLRKSPLGGLAVQVCLPYPHQP